MTEGYELQDGIFVREDRGGIAIENTWNLGSSNRILRLDGFACQRLLDFLIEGSIDDLPSSARAAQLQRAADASKQPCPACGDKGYYPINGHDAKCEWCQNIEAGQG